MCQCADRENLLLTNREYTFFLSVFAQKIKFDTISTVSPSISYEVMGPDAGEPNNPLGLEEIHFSKSFP